MKTSSNGNIFRVTGHLCGEFTGHRWLELPAQTLVTRSSDVFFDLRLNKRLSEASRRRWFETPSRSSWRHCNVQETTFALSVLSHQQSQHWLLSRTYFIPYFYGYQSFRATIMDLMTSSIMTYKIWRHFECCYCLLFGLEIAAPY